MLSVVIPVPHEIAVNGQRSQHDTTMNFNSDVDVNVRHKDLHRCGGGSSSMCRVDTHSLEYSLVCCELECA